MRPPRVSADAEHGKDGGADWQLANVGWADVRRAASPGSGDESARAFGGSHKEDQGWRNPDLESESATLKKSALKNRLTISFAMVCGQIMARFLLCQLCYYS